MLFEVWPALDGEAHLAQDIHCGMAQGLCVCESHMPAFNTCLLTRGLGPSSSLAGPTLIMKQDKLKFCRASLPRVVPALVMGQGWLSF